MSECVVYIFQMELEIWLHGDKDRLVKQATKCEASISFFGIIFWDSTNRDCMGLALVLSMAYMLYILLMYFILNYTLGILIF